jgi:DNA-directed RNA polymerase specialized sigma24 family protein
VNVVAWWRQEAVHRASTDGPRSVPLPVEDLTVAELGTLEAQALFGFVRRLGLTDDQADDAVQEVLVRLLGQLRNGSAIVNPRAWVYRSIYRLAMDEHRLRRRWAGLVARARPRHIPDRPDIADRIAVWSEVDRLPRRQREVIYLRYRSDLAFDEHARMAAYADLSLQYRPLVDEALASRDRIVRLEHQVALLESLRAQGRTLAVLTNKPERHTRATEYAASGLFLLLMVPHLVNATLELGSPWARVLYTSQGGRGDYLGQGLGESRPCSRRQRCRRRSRPA